MLANYLIGLREGLEATLIVTILIAYVIKINRRDALTPLWCGVGSATILALVFGAVLTFGTYGLTFEAQETIGGFLSIIATGFVTWMIFWMLKTGANLKNNLTEHIDRHINTTLWGLVIVAFLAISREGIETTLFIWAAAKASGETVLPFFGATLGIVTAIILGWFIYRGMLTINLSRFFTWTGGLLIIIAAGVLAYGVHDLQEAGVFPGLHNLAFDVSAIIPPDSWYGTLLKGTLNFSPATTWWECVTWWTYVIPVSTLFLYKTRLNRIHRNHNRNRTAAPDRSAPLVTNALPSQSLISQENA